MAIEIQISQSSTHFDAMAIEMRISQSLTRFCTALYTMSTNVKSYTVTLLPRQRSLWCDRQVGVETQNKFAHKPLLIAPSTPAASPMPKSDYNSHFDQNLKGKKIKTRLQSRIRKQPVSLRKCIHVWKTKTGTWKPMMRRCTESANPGLALAMAIPYPQIWAVFASDQVVNTAATMDPITHKPPRNPIKCIGLSRNRWKKTIVVRSIRTRKIRPSPYLDFPSLRGWWRTCADRHVSCHYSNACTHITPALFCATCTISQKTHDLTSVTSYILQYCEVYTVNNIRFLV